MEGWLWLILACLLWLVSQLYKLPHALAGSFSACCVAFALSLYPLSDLFQVTVFLILAVSGGVVAQMVSKKSKGFNNPSAKDAPKLLGTKVSVLKPITRGVGKIQIQDCIWEAASVDEIDAGVIVEVIGFTGKRLHVASCISLTHPES